MLTRRAALALGGLSLTGCSVDSMRPAKPAPKIDHDAALIAKVRTAMERARDRATGTPFAALHTAQLAALDTAPGTASSSPAATPGSTPPAAPATADQVRASETALQRRLLGACQHARSGQLASVFASMAAGIAQELA